MRVIRIAVAMAAALGWVVGLTHGPAVAAPRELSVGVEELDYFPAYAVQNGVYVGAAREILDAFAKDRDYVLVYRPLPIKRLFAELLSGGIDLKFPDNPEWATDQKRDLPVAYSDPVIRYIDGVMVRSAGRGRGADGVKTLGTVSGFTPFAWLDRVKDGRVQIRENPRMELLMRQVMAGRLDGAYASVAVANYSLTQRMGNPGALVFDPDLPHSRDAYRLSTLNQPKVVAEFNAWLADNAKLVREIIARTGAEQGLD